MLLYQNILFNPLYFFHFYYLIYVSILYFPSTVPPLVSIEHHILIPVPHCSSAHPFHASAALHSHHLHFPACPENTAATPHPLVSSHTTAASHKSSVPSGFPLS